MKVRLSDVKRIIREEYLRGVPEFALRQETQRYVENIRRHVFRYVLANKSASGTEQRQALATANESLEDLEEKVNALLEDSLFNFVRQV